MSSRVYTIDDTGVFVTELKNTSICELFKIKIDSNHKKTDLKHLYCVEATHLFLVDFEKIGLNVLDKKAKIQNCIFRSMICC
jgi:hypothetical protein